MSSKNTSEPKYKIDYSQDKYRSRYDRILNILFYSKEIPVDLHLHMNMSYDNFRKTISILHIRELIKRISKNGTSGYVLTLQGKKLTQQLNYMKYRDCLENEQCQYDPAHRSRKFQFAYLLSLFDRVGIPYESFRKPQFDEVNVYDNHICFYSAADFKRMLSMEAISFKGSRILGFLIGLGKIIAVYRTNQGMKSFSSIEKLIPLFMQRYFSVPVDTAILICDDSKAVIDISGQIIKNIRNNQKVGVNTADYKNFYVLPSDDTFLDRLKDVYADHSEEEQRIICQYEIDTSEKDNEGKYQAILGTGFAGNSPVLVCAGCFNLEVLKRFVGTAELNQRYSYILCKKRDYFELQTIARDYPIRVISI